MRRHQAFLLGAAGLVLALAFLARPHEEASTPSAAHATTPTTHALASSCEHSFVPTAEGTVRDYRWESDDGEGQVVLRAISRVDDGGTARIRWRIEQDGAVSELDRSCDARGATEPWTILGSVEGLSVGEQTWQIPRTLAAGDEYGGEVTVAALGMEIALRRTHRVVAEEAVQVGTRSVRALRVAVDESTERSSAPISSTQWIARDLGLVRMVLGQGAQRTEIRLVELPR